MANQIDIITTSLEALIQRATNPTNQGPDTAAIDAFCGLVNREPECSQIAAKLITAKVHSLQEWEALQALLVLETCMKRCSSHFLCEVGKFRFLNELIKLVSPKYLGAHTPESVRRRVLELMHSWTLSYPKEVKIKEAYDMLKKQGVVKSDPVGPPPREPAPPKRDQTSILQDEEKSQLLQKLLQSKNPQDLQAANRLIKTMVKEEERRNEEKWRNHMELETVVNNCRLLGEMLDSYQEGVTSDQELELIRELYNTCQNLRPALFKLASTNADPGFCHEVLTVNDELGEVFARYNSLVKSHPSGIPNSTSQMLQPKSDQPSSSLLDLSPSSDQPTSSSKDLADLGVDLTITEPSSGANSLTKSSDILKDVFVDSILSAPLSQPQPQPLIQDPFVINNLISQPQLPSVSPPVSNNQNHDNSPPKNKGLEELDLLSKMLMEQSLSAAAAAAGTNSAGANNVKDDLLASSNPSSESQPLDDDFMLNLASWTSEKNGRANPVVANSDSSPGPAGESLEPNNSAPPEPVSNLSTPLHSKKDQGQDEKTVLPLGDISVSLESIRPSKISHKILGSFSQLHTFGSRLFNRFEKRTRTLEFRQNKKSGVAPFQGLDDKNGISTVIHLAKDCPRPDVSVYVITTSTKSQSALTDFLFQPIVPKYCRLRLLTPSGTALPPHNPFLPPSAITQVMLIACPNKDPIPLKFVMSYTMDEETITEMGEIDRLLLTES